MARRAAMTYFFVLVVVEHEGRFLLVHEANHGQSWYLPAGGVEPGESLVEAAERETLEEAGVHVRPTAIVAIDQSWAGSGAQWHTRVRYVLTAEPVGSVEPKSVADRHSLEARWVTRAEVDALALRGGEVATLIDLAASGAARLPIERYAAFYDDERR